MVSEILLKERSDLIELSTGALRGTWQGMIPVDAAGDALQAAHLAPTMRLNDII